MRKCFDGFSSYAVHRVTEDMQNFPVRTDELQPAKAILLRQISLAEGSVDDIGQGPIGRWALDLPLDEPTIAAQQYLQLSADDVRAAFAKWVRPKDMVRVTRRPQTEIVPAR